MECKNPSIARCFDYECEKHGCMHESNVGWFTKLVDLAEREKQQNFTKRFESIGVIKEREKTHGPYSEVALTAQRLKIILHSTPGWQKMTDQQRESLDMICSKIGRITAGNADERDHWVDIAGYAELAAPVTVVR